MKRKTTKLPKNGIIMWVARDIVGVYNAFIKKPEYDPLTGWWEVSGLYQIWHSFEPTLWKAMGGPIMKKGSGPIQMRIRMVATCTKKRRAKSR
jgi:hypothetical protein